jgi:transketolase
MKQTTNLTELRRVASKMRAKIIETSSRTGTPHLASCLSSVDLLTALYFSVLRIDPCNPRDENRDRFIMSKGHGAMALFHALAQRGFYSEDMLQTYGEDGGVLAEHPPTPHHLAGIEAATGSLGHGLPIGLGMALSARIQKCSYNVYAILGDGECNEGSIWECAMLGAAQKVKNLCAIVDFNKWQATGRSQEIMALDSLVDKWRAFGWETCEIDGHDMGTILSALSKFPAASNKPTAIIAHTVKGKGVSFMENDNNWHYRIPTTEEVVKSKIELEVLL